MLRLSGGRRLGSPPGSTARPTASRVREAVMNRLAPELAGCRWLDLFSGSGVMGCEALQRGAALVVAVDRDARCRAVTRDNLSRVAAGLQPPPRWRAIRAELPAWLGRRPEDPPHSDDGNRDRFDIAYCDPPYTSAVQEQVVARLASGGWIRPGGLLVMESGRALSGLDGTAWELEAEKRYGGTRITYLRRRADP